MNPTNDDQSDGANAGAQAETTAGADELEALRQERDGLREQILREKAEFANYQKRTRAQADVDRQYAVTGIAGDLLEVIDNFDRALEAARSAGASSIVEGLGMVERQLVAVLAKHGIVPIEALGKPFDPNMHEALMQQPSAEHPEGTVTSELARGWRIRDRVLRPSRVAVSTKT